MADPELEPLDEEVVGELFALADTADARAMLRNMYCAFRADAQRELGAPAGAESRADRRARLHRLKGMVANYGFAGCARVLAGIEAGGTAEEWTAAQPAVAEQLARAGEELVRRFPWLR